MDDLKRALESDLHPKCGRCDGAGRVRWTISTVLEERPKSCYLCHGTGHVLLSSDELTEMVESLRRYFKN